ncbi:serine protease HTRA2, mitochondrial [Hylaeus volcanicus]|uniref:serine protease HTRA2, mitochondrial n=1 Tax=Hylaeus volcanicus TaxID=313075 RepID=UPI0023B81089|nr:serine protease HTRA2, mitochondrial [Hylaeus volcanicus]
MAAPLSRFPYSVFKQNQFQYKQILIFSCTDRFSRYRNFTTQQEKYKIFNKTIKNILTYTIFLSGFGYTLYKWKDSICSRFGSLANFIPTIHAKSINLEDINNNRDKYNFIADVVELSAPAVVNIEIKDNKRFDFFTGKPVTASNGSGFIVQSDGLILTNAHVVVNKPNTVVKVRLYDGTTYTGIVEDVDMHRDLATVRINKTNLPVMKLGSSANLRPGEFVIAIGSPLALSNTITSGIISSVNRQSEELGLYNNQMGYIQTDAAITFGNSGGPLVNLNGEAIGINAMKVTAGICFAIPIDHAKEFLKKAEMRRKGKGAQAALDIPKNRYLGVTMLSLTPILLSELQQKLEGIPQNIRNGVLICKVIVGSPAHLGGLQLGDIITSVNGEPVMNAFNIYKAIETSKVLSMTVVRKMQVLQLKVELEDT